MLNLQQHMIHWCTTVDGLSGFCFNLALCAFLLPLRNRTPRYESDSDDTSDDDDDEEDDTYDDSNTSEES